VAQAWIVPLLLVLVLLVRLAQIARESAASDGVPWAAWGGAAVLCLGLAAIGVWRQRNPGGIAIERPVLIGVLGCTVIGPLVFSIISVVVADYFLLNPLAVGAMDQLNMILAQITALSDLEREYRQPGLALIALGLALAAQRRGNPANTQVGLVFAWCLGWRWLTSEGRPLAALQFGHAEVDAVLLVGFALLAGYWALQRTLTHERALRLLALGVLMALLNQTDFLDNPFSPIFSFAGVFFLVFGIVWNVLTSGGAYLNADSPGFPRSGRLMLYLGYMLISVNVAHWYLVTHAVDVQATQAAIQNSGYLIYGLPIAYLALTSGGAEFVEEAIERPGTG
ncbi:MAG TPA: hypothetical protein PKC19_18435, partial [Roseiflexaceae bacterium]|nr:hypothetical protein [Roseiflexaceae bacterium]